MKIALPILGVAFAAFCGWLAVRIINRRERWAVRLARVVASIALVIVAAAALVVYWLGKPRN